MASISEQKTVSYCLQQGFVQKFSQKVMQNASETSQIGYF